MQIPFGAKVVRDLLEQLGWSQAALARRCKVGRSAVCLWLKGERVPSRRSINALRRVLGKAKVRDEDWDQLVEVEDRPARVRATA